MTLLHINDKWTGAVIGTVPVTDPATVDQMLTEADKAWQASWQPAARGEALHRAGELIRQQRERIVELLVAETGFTHADAETEVERGLVTLRLCAEEATRIKGDVVSLEASKGFEGRLAFTVRMPRGVVLAIIPFNTPWNGALHKVGPALASGNSVVLKPSEATPLTAGLLAEILLQAGVPEGRLHLAQGGADVALALLQDSRVAFTSFTGSTRVGTIVKQETQYRPVALELGSIAVTIVCADADLQKAADLITTAGYRKAGQVCTSVQRVFVARQVAGEFERLLTDSVAGVKVGDPRDDSTQVGPVISESSAERILGLVDESVALGARVVVGGTRERSLVAPTLVADVADDMALAREEVFGPVVALSVVDSVDEAIERANRSPYGLQAGVFTASLETGLDIARTLQSGGIVINGTSSTRADGMPFGGQNASGFGKEGPQFAIREMTVERLIMLG